MDQRLEIVLAPQRWGWTVQQVCEHFEISRDTYYRWLRRWQLEGVAGLDDRSRRPYRSPGQIDADLEAIICAMRRQHRRWGARRIRAELIRARGDSPSPSTIHQVLVRNGLVVSTSRASRQDLLRFERERPNDLWQIDGTEARLADGTSVWVIDIMDDHSRFLIGALASPALDGDAAWASMRAAIADHGVPRQVLSDNGRCFNGRLHDCVAELERRLWHLGVDTLSISAGHPQTLGKLERWHRTLGDLLTDEDPAHTIEDLQATLDRIRHHYNHERPHQGIGDATPAERYHAGVKAQPDHSKARVRATPRVVDRVGRVRYSGWVIGVGTHWTGATLRIVEDVDKVQVIDPDGVAIAVISVDEPKGYIKSGTTKPRRTNT